jgi:UDP-N-acetylmuramate--alanine ligase
LPEGPSLTWYGESERAEVRGTRLEAHGLGGDCELWIRGRQEGRLRVGAPGAHNVINALGATAAALAAGAPLAACKSALAEFHGVGRRFEVLSEVGGVTVVDDYAHHPTEIAATLAAARAAYPGRRLVAVFQPHLYSRTRDFVEQFAEALRAADLVVLTEIYPAREAPIPGVTSGLIADHVRALTGEDAVLEMAKQELATKLPPHLRPGDVVLVMGAGDIGRSAHELADRLAGEAGAEPKVAAKP